MNCEDYEALWARSGGACEACGRTLKRTKRGHMIDHDHRYGITAVRGIVCVRCNSYLARLETPRIRPAFGRGPGRWFASYFSRAWFMRHQRPEATIPELVDYDKLSSEIRAWEVHNKHLFTHDAAAVVVPTDRPAEAVRILRARMSPQAFAALVRILDTGRG